MPLPLRVLCGAIAFTHRTHAVALHPIPHEEAPLAALGAGSAQARLLRLG
jgi:hypothetical protein